MTIKIAEGNLKTKYGDFKEVLYYEGQKEAIALYNGYDKRKGRSPLTSSFILHL